MQQQAADALEKARLLLERSKRKKKRKKRLPRTSSRGARSVRTWKSGHYSTVSGRDRGYLFVRQFWRLLDFLGFYVKVVLRFEVDSLLALGKWT